MTTKIRTNFKKAIREAKKSKCNYRLGAVVVKRRKELARSHNKNKTHTLTNKDLYATRLKGVHAEVAVCLKVPKPQLEGAEIYVTRILKNGSLAMSRPCEICYALLSRLGISRVYYSIASNEYGVVEF